CPRFFREEKYVNTKTLGWSTKLLTLALAALFLCGCHGGGGVETASNISNTPSQPSPTPRTQFERDLQFIRQGGFSHVYVFSRRDGGKIDKEDADLLRKPEMKFVDVITTDEGKRVIAGTNFDFEPATLEALRQRFTIEDYTGK
ncbi:MAG: hypothetical protein WCB68_01105, partial [Pyrinomonadaceae bacterium]